MAVHKHPEEVNASVLGARLRSAREALSLELPEVAERLHLRVEVLQALENECFTGLPAPVFIKGYLRSYARLLAISEEAVLRAYAQSSPEQIPSTLPPCVHGKPKSRYGFALRVFGYFLLAGTLLALLWRQELPSIAAEFWQQQESNLPWQGGPSANTPSAVEISAQSTGLQP